MSDTPSMDNLQLDIETKILKATFVKNMQLFEKKVPHVFDYFKDYKPEKNRIGFDENGLNIVVDGAYMYPEGDKQDFIRKQVELFYQDPKKMFYLPDFKDQDVDVFKHGQCIREICELREELAGNSIAYPFSDMALTSDFIDCIIFAGVGLGYHIEKIAQEKNINYIYIYEPDIDIFYASLHSIDWSPILENCTEQGSIFFCIGYDKFRFMNELKSISQKIGAFHLSHVYLYRHYNSDTLDDSVKMFFDIGYRLSSGWGFCEDEVIGIAHTLHNLEQKYPVFRHSINNNPMQNTPVFIVANGPSLDEDIAFLKESQNKALIVTCGTAIYPLLKNGIKPDIHVEVERTYSTFTALKGLNMDEQLSQVNLIALNTVAPDVFKLFKQGHIAIKSHDAGKDLVHKHVNESDYPAVERCNPTCTNLGVEIILELGFSDVYFFGMDFGWIEGDYHHSKDSRYYDEDVNKQVKLSSLKFPGNFEEEVLTDYGLDMSKAVVEMSLQHHKVARAFNCSNGLHITGARPLHSQDIGQLNEIEDKTKAVNKMLHFGFSNKGFKDIDFKEKFENELPFIEQAIDNIKAFLDRDVASIQALSIIFDRQVKYVLDFDDFSELLLPKRFIAGTLTYFQSTIISNCYFFSDKALLTQYIHSCFDLFEEHLDVLLNLIRNCYTEIDKREDYRVY